MFLMSGEFGRMNRWKHHRALLNKTQIIVGILKSGFIKPNWPVCNGKYTKMQWIHQNICMDKYSFGREYNPFKSVRLEEEKAKIFTLSNSRIKLLFIKCFNKITKNNLNLLFLLYSFWTLNCRTWAVRSNSKYYI